MPGGMARTPLLPLEERHALGTAGGDLPPSVFLLPHIPVTGSPETERTGGEKFLRGRPPPSGVPAPPRRWPLCPRTTRPHEGGPLP